MAKKTSGFNIKEADISYKIQENCSSLTVRNNRHFLSKKDITSILCTSPARLNQAFEDIQKSANPMVIYEDFDDIEGVRYYSLSAFYQLSRHLAIELTVKERRGWCAAIEVVGKKVFKRIIAAKTGEPESVQDAMDAAKRRDGSRCQVTNQKRDKHNKINLVVHHLYSKEHHPHLGACRENLITLSEDVHNKFHRWNGGWQESCTVDDFIRFVEQFYPSNYEVTRKLNQVKQMLNPYIGYEYLHRF